MGYWAVQVRRRGMSMSYEGFESATVASRLFKRNGSSYCCNILDVNVGRLADRISTSTLRECNFWYKKRMKRNSSAGKTTLPLLSCSLLDHALPQSRHLLYCNTGLHGFRLSSQLYFGLPFRMSLLQ